MLTTLNDIFLSGDAVHAIVGLMSASVGVLLTYMSNGLLFSEAVQRTYNQGLFEDDPFLDISGTDSAQKLLVLGRELGIPLRLEDVEIEPLAQRRAVNNWHKLETVFAEENRLLQERFDAAHAKGKVLRYVQRIECSPGAELGVSHVKATATVRLEEVERDSVYAKVEGPVYHFSFHTARYAQYPLVVQVSGDDGRG